MNRIDNPRVIPSQG